MELFILFSFWAILLVAGVKIATNKGMKASTGFWWAFFLGPIGLLIVALLNATPATKPSAHAQFIGERDLQNDFYKLWLVKKYSIEKNEILGKFFVDERSFTDLDSALRYAHSKEDEREDGRWSEPLPGLYQHSGSIDDAEIDAERRANEEWAKQHGMT